MSATRQNPASLLPRGKHTELLELHARLAHTSPTSQSRRIPPLVGTSQSAAGAAEQPERIVLATDAGRVPQLQSPVEMPPTYNPAWLDDAGPSGQGTEQAPPLPPKSSGSGLAGSSKWGKSTLPPGASDR
jgi:hypothetical protein